MPTRTALAACFTTLASGVLIGGAAPVAAASLCSTDPAADVSSSDGSAPGAAADRADLAQVCVDHGTRALTVGVVVAEPTDPLGDPAWVRSSAAAQLRVNVDVDADGSYDENFLYRVEDGELVVRGVSGGCSGAASFEEGHYVVELGRDCVDSPSVRVGAYLTYPRDPDGPGNAVLVDFTEPSAPVERSTRRTSRVAGQTRIETAVAVSQRAFPDGAPVVYLAEATTFVDAVTAGSLQDGPVLLVPRCGPVPESVLDEVRRLGVEEVAAVGGPAAVCEQVLQEAASA